MRSSLTTVNSGTFPSISSSEMLSHQLPSSLLLPDPNHQSTFYAEGFSYSRLLKCMGLCSAHLSSWLASSTWQNGFKAQLCCCTLFGCNFFYLSIYQSTGFHVGCVCTDTADISSHIQAFMEVSFYFFKRGTVGFYGPSIGFYTQTVLNYLRE